jgi:hypothetical protein
LCEPSSRGEDETTVTIRARNACDRASSVERCDPPPNCGIENRHAETARGSRRPFEISQKARIPRKHSKKALFVTAKRAKIEKGKNYRYRQAEGHIHGLRHAGGFIQHITKSIFM